jgi:hypothetical protein
MQMAVVSHVFASKNGGHDHFARQARHLLPIRLTAVLTRAFHISSGVGKGELNLFNHSSRSIIDVPPF